MPYGEKLKLIKKERGLTNSQIYEMCKDKVSLPTVTRIFDEESQGGQFETYVSLARCLGFSLDELAGLKQPDEQPIPSPIIETISSYSELLKEKDERIKEKDATIKELIEDKKSIRKEKNRLMFVTLVLGTLVSAAAVLFAINLLNGHFHF